MKSSKTTTLISNSEKFESLTHKLPLNSAVVKYKTIAGSGKLPKKFGNLILDAWSFRQPRLFL